MSPTRTFKSWLIEQTLTAEEASRIDRAVTHVNSAGFDPWGLSPETYKATFGLLKFLYKDYFRVETHGIDRVPPGRVMLVANHGGQIPVDGLLTSLSMMIDAEPPRLVRGMVERWVPSVPFVSTLFNRVGQVVGDVKNCEDLLEHDQCVLVFPEGVRGSGKTIFQAYELQRFGTGFVRMALKTQATIVPVAVIGCEEIYPSVANLKGVAKLFGAPYFPLSLSGIVPLPTRVTLRFGAPLKFEGASNAPEKAVDEMVAQVKESLRQEIKIGLEKRGESIFTGSGK